LKTSFNLYGVMGFGLSSAFAVVQEWSLPEFCWSIWLAGLVYTWSCILTASLQILLTDGSDKAAYDERLPFLRRVSPSAFLVIKIVVTGLVGLISFRIYCYLFGFYGLFLSVFSEMEPLSLFGRNGFINSDFFTPVKHLFFLFWPMALGVLIANWEDFLGKNPWKRVLLPFQTEILRMHILTLSLPFLTLIAWALFGDSYQSITIVLLMGLLYLLPRRTPKDESSAKGNSNHGIQTAA
jgi:hypothetical protein